MADNTDPTDKTYDQSVNRMWGQFKTQDIFGKDRQVTVIDVNSSGAPGGSVTVIDKNSSGAPKGA